jgi:uncharacterized RDD family membrane protein YckC
MEAIVTEGPNTPPSPEGGAPGQQPPPPTPQQPQQPPAPQAPAAQNPTPQAPQAPMAPQASTVGQPADLMTRFFARVIDFVVLFIVNIVLVTTVIIGTLLGASGGGFFGGGGFVANAIGAVVSAAIYLGYFAFLESSRGQTLGKMLLKLKTEGPNGENPTMEQAIKRNIWVAFGVVGIIPILGTFIAFVAQLGAAIYIAVTINNNEATRQGYHDEFAGGTRVVKTA